MNNNTNWDQPSFTPTKTTHEAQKGEGRKKQGHSSVREGTLFVRVRGLRSALLFFEDIETNQKDSPVTPKRTKESKKGTDGRWS